MTRMGYRDDHNCNPAHIGVDQDMLLYYFSLPDCLGAAYDDEEDKDDDNLPQQRQRTRR